MQVAVADVAVPADLELGIGRADQCVGGFQEGRHGAHRHRNVVLVGGLRRDALGDPFAQCPELGRLRIALAEHAVQRPAAVQATLKRPAGRFQCGFVKLQQRIEGAGLAQGRGQLPRGAHLGQGQVGEELEGRQRRLLLKDVQNRRQRAELGTAEHHHPLRFRRGGQAHVRLHHQAQGALGADDQVPEVVAGGVLDQAVVATQHVARAGHQGQPGDPIAGEAVADHPDAASVGGDVAANLAGAGRGEIHRIEQPALFGEGLQGTRHDARLAAHQPLGGLEVQDAVHAVERHHHLALLGHRAAGEARAPARRHQLQRLRVGQSHQCHHLIDSLREHHGARRRPVGSGAVAAPVGQIGGHPGEPFRREEGGEGVCHGVSPGAGLRGHCSAPAGLPGLPMRSARPTTATWLRAPPALH